MKRAIYGTVVDQHDLKALPTGLHHGLEAIVKIGDIFLLVMQGYHNGILWHGRFYYTGKHSKFCAFRCSSGQGEGYQVGTALGTGKHIFVISNSRLSDRLQAE